MRYNNTGYLTNLTSTSSGNFNINPSASKVGINITPGTDPLAELDISGASSANIILRYNNSATVLSQIKNNSTGCLFLLPYLKFVGINTSTAPATELDIVGASGCSLTLRHTDNGSNKTVLNSGATGIYNIVPSSGLVGINNATADSNLDINNTAGACTLTMRYNTGSNKTVFASGTTGNLTITPSGGSAIIASANTFMGATSSVIVTDSLIVLTPPTTSQIILSTQANGSGSIITMSEPSGNVALLTALGSSQKSF